MLSKGGGKCWHWAAERSGSLPPREPDGGGKRGQVITEADPEGSRRSVVVADQGRPVRTIPRIPCPAEVGDPVPIGPAHVLVDVTVGAVVLAELAGHHRDLDRQGRDRRIPARWLADVEVVIVEGGDQRVRGIGRLAGQL